jgi:hypothetical protein
LFLWVSSPPQSVAGDPEVIKMLKEMNTDSEVLKHRVITMLDRRELEFLDKLGKDALFSTGHKLSYNEILKWLLDFAIEIGLTGENVNSKDKLIEKIAQKIREKQGGTQNETP